MPRHESWARFRGITAENARQVQTEGRKVLGVLMNQLRLGGIKVGKLHRWLPDGTLIIAQYDGTTPTVTAIPPQQVSEEAPPTVSPWIPAGFVVIPAADAAPQGWGIPAVPGTDDPVPLLDPGPLPVKWTQGGALPQVLLTRVANAGYPSRFDAQLPLYFDAWEAPDDDIEQPAEGTTWAAYRVRFRERGASFNAVLDEVNTRRDPDQPLTGPFFGYADMAVEYGHLIGAFGSDTSTYPIGAATAFRRVEKDGSVTAVDTDTARGVQGFGTMDAGLTVSAIVDALETAQPDLTNTTLKAGSSFSMVGGLQFFTALLDHNDQWVKCGNIDWVSSEPEIPRLSWLGPRGRSIPSFELAGAMGTWTTYDGTATPGVAFIPTWIDAAESDFQGAKLEQFSRLIYARGRILAQLPNLGYCLGAAVHKIPAHDHGVGTAVTPLTYRLVAISWHRADQKATEIGGTIDPADPHAASWDTSSDIRVWFADLPFRAGQACMPEYVVDGLYDETTNPRGWQPMGAHRLSLFGGGANFWLGDFPEKGTDYATDAEFGAPKAYWQTWLFNGSGTQATCLRGGVYNVRHPVSHGLISTAPYGPVQAIHCAIDHDTQQSLISVPWEAPNGAVFDVGDRRPIAWDYVDDTAVVAWFGGPASGPTAELRIENTAGQALVAWTFPGDTASMCHAFDARSNSAIVAAYAYNGTEFTSVDITVFHDSVQQAHITRAIGSGVDIGYGGWGNSFTYMTGPAWNQVSGHPSTLPALAVRGDDFIAALWDGAAPGGPTGAFPFHANTGYARVASLLVSSIPEIETLLGTESGWLNFAGVSE